MNGIIVKAIAGFYYVRVEDKVFQCKARGIFKKDGITPYVGDEVLLEFSDQTMVEGIINKILPRKNSFVRPPIANVDCFLVVISMKNPEPNLRILDRFLVMAEKARTDVVICLNKVDLVDKKETEKIFKIYKDLYPTVSVSCESGYGIDKLKSYLSDKKSALAGPSGVGKSSILNQFQENIDAEIGEIGHKSKRGKHTTRHVELFQLDTGGLVYDTPGFTSFDVLDAEEDELGFFYPEISDVIGNCKYDNCRHLSEPGCAVVTGVKTGEINSSRYESYISQIMDIKEKEKNKW